MSNKLVPFNQAMGDKTVAILIVTKLAIPMTFKKFWTNLPPDEAALRNLIPILKYANGIRGIIILPNLLGRLEGFMMLNWLFEGFACSNQRLFLDISIIKVRQSEKKNKGAMFAKAVVNKRSSDGATIVSPIDYEVRHNRPSSGPFHSKLKIFRYLPPSEL